MHLEIVLTTENWAIGNRAKTLVVRSRFCEFENSRQYDKPRTRRTCVQGGGGYTVVQSSRLGGSNTKRVKKEDNGGWIGSSKF